MWASRGLRERVPFAELWGRRSLNVTGGEIPTLKIESVKASGTMRECMSWMESRRERRLKATGGDISRLPYEFMKAGGDMRERVAKTTLPGRRCTYHCIHDIQAVISPTPPLHLRLCLVHRQRPRSVNLRCKIPPPCRPPPPAPAQVQNPIHAVDRGNVAPILEYAAHRGEDDLVSRQPAHASDFVVGFASPHAKRVVVVLDAALLGMGQDGGAEIGAALRFGEGRGFRNVVLAGARGDIAAVHECAVRAAGTEDGGVAPEERVLVALVSATGLLGFGHDGGNGTGAGGACFFREGAGYDLVTVVRALA